MGEARKRVGPVEVDAGTGREEGCNVLHDCIPANMLYEAHTCARGPSNILNVRADEGGGATEAGWREVVLNLDIISFCSG